MFWPKLLLVIVAAIATILLVAKIPKSHVYYATSDDLQDDVNESQLSVSSSKTEEEPDEFYSFGATGKGRFLVQKSAPPSLLKNMTCDKYPRVCRQKGSPGKDCCKKKCTNVNTDSHNCGKCGKKCKYHEMCCKGKCKDIRNDKKNCGGCKIKCKKGVGCNYGMCNNYA